MKVKVLPVLYVSLIAAAVCLGGISSNRAGANRQPVPLPGLRAEDLNSLNSILFELAAEKHAIHSSRGEKMILTLHEGRGVRKFTDGKWTVLSLPIAETQAEVGLCCYVRQYNSFVENQGDEMVREKRYQEAAELYRLLVHFDRCGGLWRETLEKKLGLLLKISDNTDVENNQAEFEALCLRTASHMNLARSHMMAPTVVSNLFEVNLP